MTQFYTYLHCAPDGVPFYVGKGSGNRAYRLFKNRNPHHARTVKKHGKDAIGIFIFNCETEEQALSDEKQQISQFKKEGINLCNMTDGGDGVSGHKHSLETRKIIKEKRANQVFTEETREKLRQLSTGRKHSEKTILKMSEIQKGRKKTESQKEKQRVAMTGRKFSEDHKKAISSGSLGKKMSQSFCASVSERNRGNTWAKGRIYSPETIEKIRQGNKGRVKTPEEIAKTIATKAANRKAKK